MPFVRLARTAGPRSTRRSSGAVALTSLLLVGGTVLAAGPAAAAETAESHAEARFLSGSLLRGTDLDRVVNLAGVSAANIGLEDSVIEFGSVGVTALDTVQIPLEGGVTIPLGDLMQLGAANQYAEAAPDGLSRSASGAVTDTGVVNTAGNGAFPSEAQLSLTPFLADLAVDELVSDVDLTLRGISAVAALDAAAAGGPAPRCADLSDPAHCRDYNIASGDLSLTAPGLGALAAALTGPGGAAATVDQAVHALAGNTGPLAQALAGTNSSLAPLLGNNALSVTVTSNVEDSLDSIVSRPLSDGVVTVDLSTGRVTADLEGLLGVQLDDLPPNTELITAELFEELAARVTSLLRTLPGLVESALTDAVRAASVSIAGTLCAPGSTGAECTNTLPLLGTDVGSGVFVSVAGSLGDVIAGTAASSVTVKAAGVETALPATTVLSALATPINSSLLADGAAVDTAVAGVDAALTTALDALAPVFSQLAGLVSIMVNVQEAGSVPGSYREVALRLTLAGAAGPGGLATVDLARVQVGANALPTTDEEERPEVARPPVEVDEEPDNLGTAATLPETGGPQSLLGLTAALMIAAGAGLMRRRRTATS